MQRMKESGRMGSRVAVSGVLLLIAIVMGSCRNGESEMAQPTPQGDVAQIEITSTAFEDGGTIPQQYTCDGPDISPPLRWDAVPEGTQSIALIADDPDAPSGTFVHWVLYNLPADVRELSEDLPNEQTLTNGATQGINDFGKIGYGGPCPPSGTHRYFFKLYALDTKTDLPPGESKSDLLGAMEGHVLGQGQIMGRYTRQR